MDLFIVGLPRSRTAWLSVFMSQSGIKFYHEAVNGCNSIEEYKNKINGYGDSTTALNVIDHVITNESKIVIIDKNKEELEGCINWCNKEYNHEFKSEIKRLGTRLMAIDGLRINQSEINERLQDIWEYLVDAPWDESYSYLTNFNIQAQSTEIDKEAARNIYESMQ